MPKLRQAVKRAIEMKDGADRIAEAFAAAGGAAAAADSLETLVPYQQPVSLGTEA